MSAYRTWTHDNLQVEIPESRGIGMLDETIVKVDDSFVAALLNEAKKVQFVINVLRWDRSDLFSQPMSSSERVTLSVDKARELAQWILDTTDDLL